MPSSLTHYWFIKECLEKNKEKLIFLEDFKNVAYLGAQGPDVYFFYGMIPFFIRSNKKTFNHFGVSFHNADPSQNFNKLIAYAENLKGKEKKICYSYLFGFLAHYTLDRKMHPFVYTITGTEKTKKNEIAHVLFETKLDVAVLNYFQTTPHKVKTYQVIRCDKNNVKVISNFFSATFPTLQKNTFFNAYKDMVLGEKILFDRFSLKRKLLKCFGLNNSKTYNLIHMARLNNSEIEQCLNMDHLCWVNPFDKQEYYSDFFEFYNFAMNEMNEITRLLNQSYNGKTIQKEIVDFCKKLDFNGITIN